ncbi:LPXTG-motif cell wall-anchored protein [Micromonospora pisi]|uniref:LPXTG-motif cell wall-anchored protein n=1 Tax=Micromonospora pisi TaxID=589240 RepID=A0A495JPC7_9ACTN|nr:LPXTG cell wall anchor domain-containing protein [Micromonospora pisi]RKR90701.1 LPXTG-motif cell wall-anchored protein [Micromonospora pisi]
MSLPKLSLRRPLAILGAGFIGLAATLAVAGPASAHHSEVKGQFACDVKTGEYVGHWTIDNVGTEGVDKYRFILVDAKKSVGDITSNVTIPGVSVTEKGQDPQYPRTVGKFDTEELRYPGDTTQLSLTVQAEWKNTYTEKEPKGDVVDLAGNCKAPEPEPEPTTPKPDATVNQECDGIVEVVVSNGKDATAPAKFTIVAAGDYKKTVTVAAGKSETVKVPAENAGDLKVTAEGVEKPLFDGKPAEPADCVAPGEPTGSYQSTCDDLVFEIVNPADGEKVELTLTPSKGEPQQLVVEPGKTGTVKFPASEGLTVTPSGKGLDDTKPIAWEKPADCTKGEAGGSGDELPLTGAAAGGIAATAVALLGIGIALFVVARRRKMRFTA